MRVLILDSDPDLGRILGNVLTGADVQIGSWTRPGPALAALSGGRPDVVVVDLDLPGKAGLAFLSELGERQEARASHVLLKSVFYTEEDEFVRRAIRLRRGAHFVKGPISLLDLSDFIRRLASTPQESSAADTRSVWSQSSRDLGASASGRAPSSSPGRSSSSRRAGRRRQVMARALRGKTARQRDQGPPNFDRLAAQLSKEVERLAKADDYTVLGIPRTSAMDLVDKAEARLLQRYGDLLQERDAPERLKEHAGKLLTWVREAADRLRAQGVVAESAPVPVPTAANQPRPEDPVQRSG